MPDQPLPYYVNYLPLLMQIAVACVVAGGMVALSALIGKHRYSRTKMQAYECGMVGTGDARQRFSVKFYMVAMLFILDRKSTRLNSSHANISYAVFCLKKK